MAITVHYIPGYTEKSRIYVNVLLVTAKAKVFPVSIVVRKTDTCKLCSHNLSRLCKVASGDFLIWL